MAETAYVDDVDGADGRALADAGDVELDGVGIAEDGQLGADAVIGCGAALDGLGVDVGGVFFGLRNWFSLGS